MNNVVKLSHDEIIFLVNGLHYRIKELCGPANTIKLYPVPRGGVPVAYLLLSMSDDYRIVHTPEEASFIVDDLFDSGATFHRYSINYPGKLFVCLIHKPHSVYEGKWIVFPWEGTDNDSKEETIEDNVRRIIQYIGDDQHREGLQETPDRVIKAYGEIFAGYHQTASDVLKTFEDGAGDYNEMVVVNDLPFYSACEHHMEAIFGTASIAYIPQGRIVGLSKLSRVLEVFARRLQVQERLTVQVANALEEHLEPLGVGVLIRARHLCMERRGICKQGHHTVTSALRGVIRTDAGARSEFLKITESHNRL